MVLTPECSNKPALQKVMYVCFAKFCKENTKQCRAWVQTTKGKKRIQTFLLIDKPHSRTH